MNVEEIIKTERKLPLVRRTIIHLLLVQNMINEQMASALKPFGVSIQQFNVLRILRGQAKKPANLNTLNDRMVSKMSNTSRLVDKLILKGYVAREICETNRRKIEITITKSGKEVLSEMDAIISQKEKDLTSGFTHNELQELNNLLDKF
ncbi:MarR family winged helix-turn-helix transcriptional regulator [Eudoraea chungangensis]|uniref:MarR family winged helix-turn-helix transcriptional regulator n=1 Tax=Eudoraea chungangensis TaxID=1481905 RepID=UPI0023ED54B6|nr:MarR family transcriptional regulator [Eudoraea chungangensis]